MRVIRALVAFAVFAPCFASAAGLSFGENGTKALSLGGAFTGQADDLTAIQHNPAGLSQLRGFHFLVDLHLEKQDVRFVRPDKSNEVSNSAGIFPLPNLGLGYGMSLLGRDFTLAIGVYGPPAIGRYQYPEPNYHKTDPGSGRPPQYDENPRKFAPQRYALISNDMLLAYPSLSAAWRVHRAVSLGVSLQYVYSHVHFRQAITGSDAIGILSENPDLDAIGTADMSGKPNVTGVLGVMVFPSDKVQFGASVRPPTKIAASGTMDIALGELAASTATITGNKADLEMTLPWEVKVGTHVKPLPAVGINADVVYEGWQSLDAIVVTPIDIEQKVGSADPVKLGQIKLPRHWHHTFSGRLGASYLFNFGLELRAGLLYEQQASDPQYFNIDFPHLSRAFGTVGASYTLGPIELAVAGAWTPNQTYTVENSEVRQTTSNPSTPGLVVGNGTYNIGGFIASVGIRGHFGAGASAKSAPAAWVESKPENPSPADHPAQPAATTP